VTPAEWVEVLAGMPAAGLKRCDEWQLNWLGPGEKRGGRRGRFHAREPQGAALFHRLDGYLLPVLAARFGSLVVELNHDALGEQRDDTRSSQLGRFLDDRIEEFPLGQRLKECQLTGRAGQRALRLHCQRQQIAPGVRDAASELAARAIEDDRFIATAQAQHAKGVLRLAAGERQ
jgi:hypothetical protein